MHSESNALTGEIQVLAEAGCRVQVDGRVVGNTQSDEGGILIKGLPAGRHTVRVVRDGFSEQSFTVSLEPGQVAAVRVGVVLKEMRVVPGGMIPAGTVEQRVGHVKVVSVPVECSVEFLGHTYSKSTPELNFENVPVGGHPIVLLSGGQRVEGRIVVAENRWREFKADFGERTVTDLTAIRDAEIEREREEARRRDEELRRKTREVERLFQASQRPVLFELHPVGALFPDREPGTGRYDYQCYTFEVRQHDGKLLKPVYTNHPHTIEVFGGNWETLRIAYERIKVRSLWMGFKRRYDVEIRSASPFTAAPKPGTKLVLRLSHPEDRCVVDLIEEIPDFVPKPE